jgi:hypothetical protein
MAGSLWMARALAPQSASVFQRDSYLPHGNGYDQGLYGATSRQSRHDVGRLQVTDWTRDTISAEVHTVVGGTSYLHIAINAGAPDKAEAINITKSLMPSRASG